MPPELSRLKRPARMTAAPTQTAEDQRTPDALARSLPCRTIGTDQDPGARVVVETSASGRAWPSSANTRLPPRSRIGSTMRRYSSTRSCSTSCAASDALPQTWSPCRRGLGAPGPRRARRRRAAGGVRPRQVLLAERARRDVLGELVHAVGERVAGAAGQAAAIVCQVRRPKSSASVVAMTSPLTAPMVSGSKYGPEQPRLRKGGAPEPPAW